MKRCPQCEFIYEDDQSLCDMDGILLVGDTRTLPKMQALVSSPSVLPARTHTRNRTFPAVAALMLVPVLSIVYYVSSQRYRTRSLDLSPASSTSAPSFAPNVVLPPSEPHSSTDPATSEASASPVEIKATADKSPKSASDASARKSKATVSQKSPGTVQRSATSEKGESKVGSILKKTGRILKKPFKF